MRTVKEFYAGPVMMRTTVYFVLFICALKAAIKMSPLPDMAG